MILGYNLLAQDNGAHFFPDDVPDGILCPNCGTCLDYSWHPQELSFSKKKALRDVSYTYDGRLIVSRKFKDFCTNQQYRGIQFHKVFHEPELYYLFPERILPFDSERRKTRFVNKCEICGGYESIVGADPTFLRCTAAVSDGIFRSDLAFASGKEKFPVVIVGPETYGKMKAARLTGLIIEKIES